jgi:hypothetical protein
MIHLEALFTIESNESFFKVVEVAVPVVVAIKVVAGVASAVTAEYLGIQTRF